MANIFDELRNKIVNNFSLAVRNPAQFATGMKLGIQQSVPKFTAPRVTVPLRFNLPAQFTATKQIAGQNIQPMITLNSRAGGNLPYKAMNWFERVQGRVESPQPFKAIPTIQQPVKGIPANIGKFGYNMAAEIGNVVAGRLAIDPAMDVTKNAIRFATGKPQLKYSELKSPLSKTAYMMTGLSNPRARKDLEIKYTPQEMLANAGSIGEALLYVVTGGQAGTAKAAIGKTITETAVKDVAKQSLKQLMIKGGKAGAKFGAEYGFLTGLAEGREAKTPQEQLTHAVIQSALMTVPAAVLGAGVPVTGVLLSKTAGKVIKTLKSPEFIKYLTSEQGFAKTSGQVAKGAEVRGVPSYSTVATNLPEAGTQVPPLKTSMVKPSGVSTIRYVSPSQEINLGDISVPIQRNVTTLIKNSQENTVPFKSQIEQATGIKADVRVKTTDSLLGKIERYKLSGKNPNTIADVLAGKIETTADQIPQQIGNIERSFPGAKVENYYNSPTGWGYRGVNITVPLGNGRLAEIQVHTPETWQVTRQIHPLYEKWRNVDITKLSSSQLAQYRADKAASNAIADKILGQATKGVEGVSGKVGSEVKLPTQLELPQELTSPKVSSLGQTSAPKVLSNQGRLTSPKIISQESKPVTEAQAFRDWERAIKNETVSLGQRNALKAKAATVEDKALLGGVRAYKGGKIPETTSGFPGKALSGESKDKGAFSYQRETLLRNIEDTFKSKEEAQAVKDYFHKPIVENETAKTKFTNNLLTHISDVFKKAGIGKKSKMDYAAADYIEGTLPLESLQKEFPTKWQGIVNTAEEGRAIYKGLLSKINNEITKYGYDAIPERQNYVTHTQQIQTFMDTIGNLTNLGKDKLPTAMASIHLVTKPGRQFFSFGLKRAGGSTHEGLITALEKYIVPAGNQIFHTADVQRGRALEQFLMKQSEGTQNRNLSNFLSYLGQYVDSISGKQNILDRPIEKVFGRKALAVGNWLRKRTGANMIGGNLSSAIVQFIPFTQSMATTPKLAMVKGLFESAMSPAKGLNVIDGIESGFLTRRYPQKGLQTLGEKAIGSANLLFKWIDGFSSKAIVAGKYFENLDKGMSKIDAMKVADEYAARVMTDRSFGQIPLLFKSKTLGALTQFQTEVNNQMSFLLKDIPKNLGYNKAEVVSALGQFVIYSYLFNNLYEQITGYRPQVDVLHAGISAYQKYKAGAGLTDYINPTDRNTPVGEVLQQLPFTSTFAGGRIPVGSAVPNIPGMMAGTADIRKELTKPATYIFPPTAGGQLKKVIEGGATIMKGYSETGKGQVRFPVKQSPQNAVRSVLFGQYATPEARQYFNLQRQPLSEKQSLTLKGAEDKQAVYQGFVNERINTKIENINKQMGEGKISQSQGLKQIEALQKQIKGGSTSMPQEISTVSPPKLKARKLKKLTLKKGKKGKKIKAPKLSFKKPKLARMKTKKVKLAKVKQYKSKGIKGVKQTKLAEKVTYRLRATA